MTLIVGILCKDGVVVASDSAATFGMGARPTIGQQELHKVHRINQNILYSCTGAVGIGQLIADNIGTLWSRKVLSASRNPAEVMNTLGKEIVKLVGPYLQTASLQHSNRRDRLFDEPDFFVQFLAIRSRPHGPRTHRKVIIDFNFPAGILRSHAGSHRMVGSDLNHGK